LDAAAASLHTTSVLLMPKTPPHCCMPVAAPPSAPKSCFQIDRPFVGRLRACSSFWEEIGAGKRVLGWIRDGFDIKWAAKRTVCATPSCAGYASRINTHCPRHHEPPFVVRPPCKPPVRKSARGRGCGGEFQSWLDGAIAELIEHGSVVEASESEIQGVYAINCVPKSCGKRFRLVHDLSELNEYVEREPFKYETLERSRTAFQKGMWATSIDLSSSYYHVDVNDSSSKWLGFEANGKIYRWVSLPFGVSAACQCFSEIMGTLATHWRVRFGITLTSYLDDSMTYNKNRDLVRQQTALMVSDMAKAGFVVNKEKSELEPSQCLVFLGVSVCFASGRFYCTDKRLQKIEDAVLAAATASPTPRQLARVAGLAQSTVVARGFVPCMLFTREIYRATARACKGEMGWDDAMPMTPAVWSELAFWWRTRGHAGGLPFDLPTFVADKHIWVDASDTAIGGFADFGREDQIMRIDLPEELLGASSTARELFGIWSLLVSFIKAKIIRRGMSVAVGTDSQCSAWGIEKGASPTATNHDLIKRIYATTAAAGINLKVTWHPREAPMAVEADRVSKIGDVHGWSISARDFSCMSATLGLPDVDGFATLGNRKCAAYFSQFHELENEGINALAQPWNDGRHWYLAPPAPLIEATIKHLALCPGARATVVVPFAPGTLWWQTLHRLCGQSHVVTLSDPPSAAGDGAGARRAARDAAGAHLVAMLAIVPV